MPRRRRPAKKITRRVKITKKTQTMTFLLVMFNARAVTMTSVASYVPNRSEGETGSGPAHAATSQCIPNASKNGSETSISNK